LIDPIWAFSLPSPMSVVAFDTWDNRDLELFINDLKRRNLHFLPCQKPEGTCYPLQVPDHYLRQARPM
jgi:hypothetical protein